MNEQDLRDYKELYKNITVSDTAVHQNWKRLSDTLPARRYNRQFHSVWGAVLVACIGVLISVVGTVGFAQTARPGDALYPIKVLSQTVTAKVMRKPEKIIEKRTDDVIKEMQQKDRGASPQRLEKALNEYESSLEETKRSVKGAHTDSDAAASAISSAEAKLKQTHPDNSSVEQLLNRAIEHTERAKQEVENEKAEGQSNRNIVPEKNINATQPENQGKKK